MQSLSSSQPFVINSTIPVQSPNSSNFTRNLSFPAKFSTTQFNSCRNRKRVSINSNFNGLQFVGFSNSHSFSNFRTTQFGSLGCVNCKKFRVFEVNCVVGGRNLGKLRAVMNVDELRLGFGSLGYVNCTKVCSFMSDGLSSGFCHSESGLRNHDKIRVFEVNCIMGRRKMGNLGKLKAMMNVDGLSSGFCNLESGLRIQNKFRVFEVNCVVNRRKMGNLGRLRAVMNVDELSSGYCNSESGLRNQNKVRVLGRLGFCNSEPGLRNQNKFRVLRAVMNVDDDEVVGGEDMEKYDAIVIGSGIGGLVAGTQLAVKGAKVLVLEKYVIPGGSSGFYERDGYTFDVGSSVMFGFSDQGNLNLITQALAAVGHKMEVIPDPTTVHFHLPNNLSVLVHRYYEDFVTELTSKFPHEKDGILKFYGVCWKIFNALNSLELKSLEEPLYLFGQFFQKPLECLTLAFYLPQNAGAIARKYIKDPELLSFIDAECFIVSTVNALQTPMINASMVLCDRHFGGINYPVGGVGGIAKSLAQGLVDKGSKILYKANVTSIILENGKAVGVRLSDGREFYARTIISNATRWDTFGKLLKAEKLPKEEESFQKLYVQAPSFLSIHMGVKAEVLPPDTDCHHFILETDWKDLEKPYGSIFLSIPTVLDPSLAPKGHHILHIFTTSSIDDWQGLSRAGYNEKKELIADEIISRLEKKLFPGLKSSITFIEVGTPKTHRRYLARDNGTYGPMPRAVPKGLLGMPFNTTAIDGLYCVGDSCFPGQGVIAVAFSGIMCAHRVAADTGFEKSSPVLDAALLRLLGWFRTLA